MSSTYCYWIDWVGIDKYNDMRENGWEEIFVEVTMFCASRKIIVLNMDDTIPLRGRSRGRGTKLVRYYHHFHHGIFNVGFD
jgi:hypothetical protein